MLKRIFQIILLLVFSTSALPAEADDWPRLEEAIKKRKLTPPSTTNLPLKATFHSYKIRRKNNTTIFAGYLYKEGPDEAEVLPDQITVLKYDRSNQSWITRTLIPSENGGIWDIQQLDGYYALKLHHTPSLATTLLLDQQLRIHDRLPGWMVSSSGSTVHVFRKGMAHGAPTHEVKLYLYSPSFVKVAKKIFPVKPYPDIRKEIIETTEKAYEQAGEEWCMEHNHHCDPEQIYTIGE